MTQSYLDCPLPSGDPKGGTAPTHRVELDEATVAWIKQELNHSPEFHHSNCSWGTRYGDGAWHRLPENDHRIVARDLEGALRDARIAREPDIELVYEESREAWRIIGYVKQFICALAAELWLAERFQYGPYTPVETPITP